MNNAKLMCGVFSGLLFCVFCCWQKIKILIGVGFIGEGKVPPLFPHTCKPVAAHNTLQSIAVGALDWADVRRLRPGLRAKEIKDGAHIQLPAVAADQCQVSGTAARVRGMAEQITLFKQLWFFQ